MASLGDEPLPKLEGRAAEESALVAALEEVRRGRGRIVVISGEAGIGKSALLRSLAERAQAGGLRPIWGRAWEFADAPAYFPVAPCLSALGLPAAQVQSETGFSVWERVLEALSRASASEPVLWLLEDLHAADLQSLDLLTFLAQPVRVLPVLIVVTTRPRDPRLSERSEQRLLRMARDGTDVRLGPLSAEQVRRLAEPWAGPLPESALRELCEVTSGNPLFVLECARSLAARGLHSLHGVTPTIRQVVLERLQLLPEATRALLQSGSVLGRDFTAALLGRMHELLPARVVDQLLPALRSGVAVEKVPGSYAFSHVLVQNAVYEGLPAEQRALSHRRAEHALEGLPSSPEISLERARHALGALTPESSAHALDLVLAAGRLLEDSRAIDRAHALYGRLREKIASGELALQLSGPEALHMAHVAERAGRSGEARALCQSVLHSARMTKDEELLALAALELGRGIRPGMIDQELVAALREALALRGETTSPIACRLRARLAAALQPDSDPNMPIEMAQEVIATARGIGDPELVLEVLDVAGSACVDYAPLELRLELSRDLLDRAIAAKDFVRTQRARSRLAFESAELGDFAMFELQVAEALSESEQAGTPQARVRPLLMASLMACCRGEVGESQSLVTEAQELLSLTDDPSLALSVGAHGMSRASMLLLEEELERYEAALPRMVRGVPAADFTMRSLRAFLRARLERRAEAEADLLVASPLMGKWDVGGFACLHAEVAAYVGQREICGRLRELLTPVAGREAMGGQVSVSYEGPVDRLLGLLDAALGDHARAEQRLVGVLAVAERRGFTTLVAQIRDDLGKLLSSLNRRQEAREHWAVGLRVAEACELSGYVLRLTRRLTGEPVASPPERLAPSGGTLRMTREGDLYHLERDGLSARIRASRGAELLARLIEAPEREIHVLALAYDEAGASTESHAGDASDMTALRRYRARLADLGGLVADAEARADLGQVEALRREQSALEREVARALGLGGRMRQTGSTTERARVNVQRRLKDAVERVREANPELGVWLTRCVRTGTYCSFRPTN